MSSCVCKISFKSVQVCGGCCKMFRWLTFLGHSVSTVSWPSWGSSSLNYKDPCVVTLSLVYLCLIKVWEHSVVLLWAIPLRGCDWILGDTGISSGQQEYYITDCAINRHRKSTIIYIGGDVSAALVRLVSNAITMSSVYPPSCGQRTSPPGSTTETTRDCDCKRRGMCSKTTGFLWFIQLALYH